MWGGGLKTMKIVTAFAFWVSGLVFGGLPYAYSSGRYEFVTSGIFVSLILLMIAVNNVHLQSISQPKQPQ